VRIRNTPVRRGSRHASVTGAIWPLHVKDADGGPFESMWTRARAGNVNVGDVAPDFTLSSLDKSSHLDLATLRKEKPVVLVFGSYT
jgi:hypothetical protein